MLLVVWRRNLNMLNYYSYLDIHITLLVNIIIKESNGVSCLLLFKSEISFRCATI